MNTASNGHRDDLPARENIPSLVQVANSRALWATLNLNPAVSPFETQGKETAATGLGNITGTMTHILLTNDDGIQGAGLRALADAVAGLGTVSIVAPSQEQSGAAQSLTLRQPIVCHSVGEREWAVDGTPADCVIVALHKLLAERPDIVISGINYGANLGENVYYSGTVGAAREAALHHIPAIAMSLCSKAANVKFEPAARVARAAAELILKEGLPDQVLLNVNVPEPWNGEVKFTRQSQKITRNQ